MTTLILGAHGPLGLACARAAITGGSTVFAGVQAPHRIPPALHDLRDEAPTRLTAFAWQPGQVPTVPPITRAIVAELPVPPTQTDESDDPAADLRALTVERALAEAKSVLAPTLAALQLIAALKPRRLLIQASWLGSIDEKIRGGGYAIGIAYSAQLMLVRAAALDLSRAGIATVVGNAGRYRMDMAGPGFHADVDDVANGLLALLDDCDVTAEPTFRDWRGAVRRW